MRRYSSSVSPWLEMTSAVMVVEFMALALPISEPGRRPRPATRQKTPRPSSDPRQPSDALSGWGIIPTTLPRSFETPAMPFNEPFGFAWSVTSPSRLQ